MTNSHCASLVALNAHLPREQVVAFSVDTDIWSGGRHLAPCPLGGLLSGSWGVSWLCPSEVTLRPRSHTVHTVTLLCHTAAPPCCSKPPSRYPPSSLAIVPDAGLTAALGAWLRSPRATVCTSAHVLLPFCPVKTASVPSGSPSLRQACSQDQSSPRSCRLCPTT